MKKVDLIEDEYWFQKDSKGRVTLEIVRESSQESIELDEVSIKKLMELLK